MDIASHPMQCAVVDITKGKLDPASALDFVSDPAFGGITMFVGKVRENNLGREVTGVSYDMFDPLALTVFAQAVVEAQAEVGNKLKVHVSHAKGRLAVGDIAVVVAAGTPHRDEAFRACRMIIEKVKHQAPIWKQEHYVDGDSVWSEGCSLCEAAHEHKHG
ncbi:MAG TPA: molybdenum cofactor biosynthesis protein MoaE [Arenimonas sp.]|nr:molybdenum cofactor biosynthesis protein MoaE [Arenimonas sp.]